MQKGYTLLKHQTFESIAQFESDPDDVVVMDIVSKHYQKTVVSYEFLDRENIMFEFEDGTYIELLLRKIE